MTFNLQKHKILSFDIETSRLDPGRPGSFIWGTGYAQYDSTGKETKVGNLFRADRDVDSARNILSDSEFGKKQLAAGRFDSLLNDYDRLPLQSTILQDFVTHTKGSGANVLLIQNANFERRWMESMFNMPGANSSEISDIMRMGIQTADGIIPSFNPSADILEKRSAGLKSYYKFLETGDNSLFEESAKAYQGIMESYAHQMQTSKKMFVMDQIDLTRGLFFKAAEMGLIDKKYVNIGTSQSFLSRILLDTEELHLAAEDASQTLETTTKHILPMYNDLMSGNPSQKTLDMLGEISGAQKGEASNQLIRSLNRAYEEALSPQGYGYYDTFAPEKPKEILTFDTETGASDSGILTFKTQKKFIKDDLAFVTQDVLRRYHGIDTPGIDKDQILEKVLGLGTNEEKVKYVSELEGTVDIKAHTPSLPNGKVMQWLKDNPVKSIAGVVAAASIATIAFSDSDNMKAKEAKKQLSQSVDNNLRIYSKPKISIAPEHGSGFADWNERSGHHEY